MSDQELIDVVDDKARPIGVSYPKSLIHSDGYWHATAHVWVYHPSRGLLLQKRSPQKSSYPNVWDVSCAGHISAGESPEYGACRECVEELGLELEPKHLEFLQIWKAPYSIPARGWEDNEYHYIYLLRRSVEINDLTLDIKEVSGVKYITPRALLRISRGSALQKTFAPHKPEYYQMVCQRVMS